MKEAYLGDGDISALPTSTNCILFQTVVIRAMTLVPVYSVLNAPLRIVNCKRLESSLAWQASLPFEP